ncbi:MULTISPECIES: hypothetical protein [Thalassospira]|jgi:uncharacterized membrane protein|uniref:Uncharacterized protein n=2 Tax=Thalassospira TaxID=168934 RepID=A0A367W6Z5_9PROT|nr:MULTISPECIES: hypothetical protein [Thalassospira]MDG4719616.1 hypothetical protein [Thalassospira sp. FZY0004]RCK36342.1 hypothetical protein TH19_13820 [Thalassospira profundimaris]
MEIGSFWGVVMIVVGAAAAMIVARIARRPFRHGRGNASVQREKTFLHRPLNLIALLVAVGVFVLGLFWKMTGGGPN